MIGILLVVLVALAHVGFFVLESILWAKPTGRKVFRMSEEQARATQVLAANQGVYNLALALGLVWTLLDPNTGATLLLLTFIVAVGVYGAATVSRSIFFLQSLPAILAMGFFWTGI